MPSDARDFVLANTVLAASPLVPEIKLHLAAEVTPLWQATEAALERHQLPPPYWAFAWAGGLALDGGGWDVILAGDMCYERPLAERLLVWLEVRARGGALVLLGDPGRAYLPKSGIAALARYVVPTPLDLEDRVARETTVWRLTATR